MPVENNTKYCFWRKKLIENLECLVAHKTQESSVEYQLLISIIKILSFTFSSQEKQTSSQNEIHDILFFQNTE